MTMRPSELALSEVFAAVLPVAAKRAGIPELRVLIPEFEARQGRADYVGAPAALPKLRRSAAAGHGRALARPSAAIVYTRTCLAPRSPAFIARDSGLSLRTVRTCLSELRRAGLLTVTPRGTFVRVPGALPQVELWAFEVKVADWRRALFQALQYQAFAHCVAVIMPSAFAHRATRRAALFRQLGVGLFSLSGSGEEARLLRLVSPRRRAPASGDHHVHAIGRLIARVAAGGG